VRTLLVITAIVVFGFALAPWAQRESAEEASARLALGHSLYIEHCAACHGPAGRGDGAVARVLTGGVPDLTRLSREHGGRFPRDEVYRSIDGRRELAAHGSRLMPVWGLEFWLEAGADERAELEASERINALVAFLESQQR
jgi:mono/diheme cytochrome c family protein